MKHFITGGSGFAGLHIIDRLLQETQDVTVYDITQLDNAYQKKGVRFVEGDIRDQDRLREAMRGADFVHHNAAVLPVSRSGKVFRDINVQGTECVLQAAKANGVRKVIAISTSSVYGIPTQLPITLSTPLTPLGDYGWSKYEAEQVVKKFRAEHNLDVSIVRPRTIIGTGRMGIFGILFDWVRRGKRIYIIGRGENLYQLLSAPDFASACYLMTIRPCNNQDFLLGAEVFGTVKEDLEALIRHASTTSKVQPTNAFLVRNILAFVDFLKISPLVDWHYKTPHKPFYFDISETRRVLGWQPKDSNALMFTQAYDWYLEHRRELDTQTGTTHRKSVKQGILKILRAIS